MLAAAANTYKTMSLSINVARTHEGLSECFQSGAANSAAAFKGFQNLQLKRKLQRLTDRMLDLK